MKKTNSRGRVGAAAMSSSPITSNEAFRLFYDIAKRLTLELRRIYALLLATKLYVTTEIAPFEFEDGVYKLVIHLRENRFLWSLMGYADDKEVYHVEGETAEDDVIPHIIEIKGKTYYYE